MLTCPFSKSHTAMALSLCVCEISLSPQWRFLFGFVQELNLGSISSVQVPIDKEVIDHFFMPFHSSFCTGRALTCDLEPPLWSSAKRFQHIIGQPVDQTTGCLPVGSRVDCGAVDGTGPKNPSSSCSCCPLVSSVYDLSAFGSSSWPGLRIGIHRRKPYQWHGAH